MTTLTANSQGVISGKFTIPSGVRAGAKAVRAVGHGGSQAEATFTGRGIITTIERRLVTVINEVQAIDTEQPSYTRKPDPLAQTFTLPEGRHTAGVDLWFSNAGDKDVIVQIRETSVGFPTQNVLAQKRLKVSDINTTSHTRILFSTPVWLDAGREYAIVVLTDSATTRLRIAELGKFDATAQKWITSQPYQVGVLLSSSNASTWTAHQDRDLTFRLLACKFTATSRTIPLGTTTVADMSDMIARYNADIPATGASGVFQATLPSGEVYQMAANSPVSLPSRSTGTVTMAFIMEGTEKVSPVLYPGIQFIAGDMDDNGDYVSRQFPVGSSARISITLEAFIPGTSGIVVEIQKADMTWQTLTLTSGTSVGDGLVERSYILTGFTAANTRVRITTSGTAQYRPKIRKLRAVSTD